MVGMGGGASPNGGSWELLGDCSGGCAPSAGDLVISKVSPGMSYDDSVTSFKESSVWHSTGGASTSSLMEDVTATSGCLLSLSSSAE